jgi:hypothetical protein
MARTAKTAKTAKSTALSPVTTSTDLTHPGGIPLHDSWANMPRETMARDYPRLMLCQNMSKCRQKNDPNYIEGIQEGDYYNNKTDQIYGRGPLTFSILADHGFRGTEYDESRKVIDYHVSSTDPRMRRDPTTGIVKAEPSQTWTIYLHDTKESVFFRNAKGAYYQVAQFYYKLIKQVGVNNDMLRAMCTVQSQNTPAEKGSYERPVFHALDELVDPDLLKLLQQQREYHQQAGIRPSDLDPPVSHATL